MLTVLDGEELQLHVEETKRCLRLEETRARVHDEQMPDNSADAVHLSYVSHPGPTAVAGPTHAQLPAQTEHPLTPQPAPSSPPMVPASSIAARGAVTRALQELCALAVMGARVATAYSDLNICLQRHQTDIVDQVLQLFQCLAEGVPSSTLVCLSVAVRVFFFTST